ncbi:MAG: hypothetical protein ACJAXI_000243 [Crocinitomicaceae bacterium]|jgi:hypothetical protein
MTYILKIVLFLGLFLGPLAKVNSQCVTSSNIVTTYAHNNGFDGTMFDVVAINDIIIVCFDANFDPGTLNYEIYFKLGTAQGFEASPVAWTLVGNGFGIASAGNGNPTPLNLNSSIGVCGGDRVSFYITNTGAGSADANYTNGTAINNVGAFDANLQVRTMYGKQYPFAASYSPRRFNGTIHYNTGGCSPLPVELLNFEAKQVENRKVSLDWQTASEVDNDYFEVHRSIDLESWELVTTVDGAGNSIELLSYSAEDLEPYIGLSYYKLIQVDNNGESTLSDIRSVNLQLDNERDLSIYPNPTLGVLNITGSRSQLEKLEFLNSVGKQLEVNILASGEHSVTIDVSNLSQGVYLLKSGERSYKILKK